MIQPGPGDQWALPLCLTLGKSLISVCSRLPVCKTEATMIALPSLAYCEDKLSLPASHWYSGTLPPGPSPPNPLPPFTKGQVRL